MKKIITLIIIPVVLIILFSVLVNNKESESVPEFSERPQADKLLGEQKDEQGEVSVAVIPDINSSEDKWEFKVILNTHSVALDQDMVKVSTLFDDAGNSYTPTAWNGDEPGGHHREGVLQFDSIVGSPKTITLRIKNVGGIPERTFQWSLNN